jgi:hypothetical protein
VRLRGEKVDACHCDVPTGSRECAPDEGSAKLLVDCDLDCFASLAMTEEMAPLPSLRGAQATKQSGISSDESETANATN